MTRSALNVKDKFLNYLRFKNRNLTLTIRGFMVYCTTKTTDLGKKFDWGNALIDATITSAVTFFSTLGGTALASDINMGQILQSAIFAALSQFFIFLALKRGLVKNEAAPSK
jgi:hypothetical protein